jgi:hypothetical protein
MKWELKCCFFADTKDADLLRGNKIKFDKRGIYGDKKGKGLRAGPR